MDPVFVTIFAITLVGLALLIVAGGVAILTLLKRVGETTKELASIKAYLAAYDEAAKVEWGAWREKIDSRTKFTEAAVNAINDRVTFIGNELVPLNTRSATILEAMMVMAEGIDRINEQMEKKLSKTRFVELGDAMPAIGVIETPMIPPGAEAISQKRKRKPVKKAAKKPVKKAAKRVAKKK